MTKQDSTDNGVNTRQNVISFSASVFSVRTLVDGGINVTLSLGEDSIMQVAQLLECKKDMIPLRVEIMADDKKVNDWSLTDTTRLIWGG